MITKTTLQQITTDRFTNNNPNEVFCRLCNIQPAQDEVAYFTGTLGQLPDYTSPEEFTKLLNILYDLGIVYDENYSRIINETLIENLGNNLSYQECYLMGLNKIIRANSNLPIIDLLKSKL